MKTLLLRAILLMASMLFLQANINAQKKLLILGSSTSTCFFGPSSIENCYVTKLQRYYESIGSPFILDNRAVAGDNVYQGMPLNFTPPPGRSSPRPFNNITEGLAANPDVVLINFPSNGYDFYSVDEVMNCLRVMKQAVNGAGKPCYVTTTQPRNDPQSFQTAEVRNRMLEIKNRVLSEFGAYAINFWDGLANPDNSLIDMYQVDGVHINDAGHQILYNRVLEKNIFNVSSAPPPPPSAGNGLTFKYYEGDWNTLPDFNTLQPIKSGTTGNIDVSARNRTDFYAFLWQGNITIPVSGNYTFELVSDDGSKLYFNTAYNAGATAFVNNDGLHPAQSVSNSAFINAGSYPIAISYFEKNGGEAMQVYWSGPGFSRQLIPNEAFGGQSTSGGLSYKYFEGDWNQLPDFNALQPARSGSIGNVDVSPRSRADYYGFLWQGNITLPTSGNYTFELVSDDGSKLYFNSQYNAGAPAFVNNDGLHAAQSVSNSTFINAGTYPIAISYFEKNGGESLQVYWSGPGIPRQLIPNSAFGGQSSANGGLKYKYFEGDWNLLPDFNALQPVKTGTLANVDMNPRNRNDYYGFLWEGFINIPAAGNYNFETISDDGSKLYFNTPYNVNAGALVNNDGSHPAQSVSNNVYVGAPGLYPIAISFFDKYGGESMQVYWSGPGFGRQPIPNSAFSTSSSFGGETVANAQLTTAAAFTPDGNKSITAFPNPFNQKLDIAYYNSSPANNITAGLYDVSGKLVHKENFKNISAGASILKMNLKNDQSVGEGVYFLKIDVNGIPFKVLKLVRSRK